MTKFLNQDLSLWIEKMSLQQEYRRGLEDEFAARLVCGGLGTEENEKVAVDFSARGKEEFVSTSITGEGTEAGDFSARGKEEFVSTSITG